MNRRIFLKMICTSIPILVFKGITTNFGETDDNFSEIADSYITYSHTDTIKIAEIIKCEKNFYPSNISGPLATSILLGWKLNKNGSVCNLSSNSLNHARMEGVIPKEMWLGSPELDFYKYDLAFPKSCYETFHIKQSIKEIDFENIEGLKSLLPGDFVYLYGGSNSHFLAISKRDLDGKVYSVTNIPSEVSGEFIIRELMLWDPKNKVGYIRNFAFGIGQDKATSGLGGVVVWRRIKKAEFIDESFAAVNFRNELINLLREQNLGDWDILLYEFGKGELFEWRKGVPYHCASTIKVPIAILALQLINEIYKDEIVKNGLENVLKVRGFERKTFQYLLNAMLVYSEEVATEDLVDFIRNHISLGDGFNSLGMINTFYEPRKTTQKDLFTCWRSLLTGQYLDNKSTTYLLGCLSTYTKNDDLLMGELKNHFPDLKQWNKRGIITKEFVTVQDSGIVEIPGNNTSRMFYIGLSGTSISGREISYEGILSFIKQIITKLVLYTKYHENYSIKTPL